MCVAIIVAAGQGLRANHHIPKQFVTINGKTFLEQCINTFSQILQISQIIVVYNPNYLAQTKSITAKFNNIKLIEGGKTRQASVYNALSSLKDTNKKVLIHDAARPFVSKALILKVIDALKNNRAVDVALPLFDTIKQLDTNKTIDRATLYASQTPQGFDVNTILNAHKQVADQHFTDDISVFAQFHDDIVTVEGEIQNKKITTAEDIKMIDKKAKTGTGFDVHKFGEKAQCTIKICGISVKSSHKLLAHSDGDVGLHALVDAIFGALAIGDIGDHFPPSDEKFKDADSCNFLKYAKQKCTEMGASINNIDITIICEAPKISPYKQSMQKIIAEILDISISDVNIKATTTEKLGYLGRAEGIAAQAICTITI